MHEQDGKEKRLTQLDGLRGIAASAVVIHHFPPIGLRMLDLGRAAVWLFFVLSGFLITGILLRARTEAQLGSQTLRGVFWAFYLRRFLRIFPLYYALLFATSLLDPRVRKVFPWFLFYLSNFYIAWAGELTLPMNHLWSLSVEEQFYLTWPALVLLVPESLLLPVFALVIAAGPLSRFLLLNATGNWTTASFFTTSCFDALGMGALMAFLRSRRKTGSDFSGLKNALLSSGVALMILYLGLGRFTNSKALVITVQYLSLSLIFACIVDRAADGFTGIVRYCLEYRPLTYLGVISYGVYVYHPFIPRLVQMAAGRFGIEFRLDDHQPSFLKCAFVLLASTLVSTMSWFVFEKPINGLKQFFSYTRRRTQLNTPNLIKSVELSHEPIR